MVIQEPELTFTSGFNFLAIILEANIANIADENSAINVYVPVNYPEETKELYKELQNQGYDLFDPNDSFYQDICTPFKSKDGTDVLLSDRKNDFYKNHNNNTQCQGNCKYVEYLLNINYLKCECNVNTDNSIETQDEQKFDKFYKEQMERERKERARH